MREEPIAVVGAGAAGLSLAHRLALLPAGRRPGVVLLDAPPGPLRPPPRTWCWWEPSGGPYDAALTASWTRLRVHAADGTATVAGIAPYRYKMLRSDAFERLVGDRLRGTDGFTRLPARVEAVSDGPRGAVVRGRDADGRPVALTARWVFDSRPPAALPAARTTLAQHFRGWFVRTARPAFDTGLADLMDFRTPQPARGVSFGYVLPFGPCEALVEYTEFSARVLDAAAYDRRLRHYADRVLGLGEFEVTDTEQGVIWMTDARFPRRAGRSVFPIGSAGGATRPSTGYTFAAVQRQSRAVAAAVAAGRVPLPPRPYRARTRAMDAVLLRALAGERLDAAALFAGLWQRVPPGLLLRFLDGGTGWAEDLRVGLRVPVAPMLAALAALPLTPRRPPSTPPTATAATPASARAADRAEEP